MISRARSLNLFEKLCLRHSFPRQSLPSVAIVNGHLLGIDACTCLPVISRVRSSNKEFDVEVDACDINQRNLISHLLEQE